MTKQKIYKVLCVEDMFVNRQLIQMILERREDLEVSFANDGQSGIEEATRLVPDIILLDISLPDFDGTKVLEILKKNDTTAQIPVIAISGDFPPDTAYSFDKYLPKPIDIKALYQAIDTLIKKPNQ